MSTGTAAASAACPICGVDSPHSHTEREQEVFRDSERLRLLAQRGHKIYAINKQGEVVGGHAYPTYPRNLQCGFSVDWLREFIDGLPRSQKRGHTLGAIRKAAGWAYAEGVSREDFLRLAEMAYTVAEEEKPHV